MIDDELLSGPLHVVLLTAVLHAKAIEGGDEAVYDALRVVIGMHQPHKVRHTDSNSCGVHGYPASKQVWGPADWDVIDDCPLCVVTYPERCSSRTCMDCGTYPCETLRKIAAVFDTVRSR